VLTFVIDGVAHETTIKKQFLTFDKIIQQINNNAFNIICQEYNNDNNAQLQIYHANSLDFDFSIYP